MCGSSTEHELARGGHVSHTLTHTLREAAATAGKNTALLFVVICIIVIIIILYYVLCSYYCVFACDVNDGD